MGCPHAWLVLLTLAKAADERGAWWAYRSTNDEIDLKKSVSLIKELPIKKYEMSHDTIQGRVHYGVLAKDAEAILAAPYGEVVTREEAVPGASQVLDRAGMSLRQSMLCRLTLVWKLHLTAIDPHLWVKYFSAVDERRLRLLGNQILNFDVVIQLCGEITADCSLVLQEAVC